MFSSMAVFSDESSSMAPGGHKPLATWKGSQRTTFDGTALKKANPSLWSEFSKTTTTRTFRVI